MLRTSVRSSYRRRPSSRIRWHAFVETAVSPTSKAETHVPAHARIGDAVLTSHHAHVVIDAPRGGAVSVSRSPGSHPVPYHAFNRKTAKPLSRLGLTPGCPMKRPVTRRRLQWGEENHVGNSLWNATLSCF